MSQYDIAVIGGGPGGYTAALRGAQRGARVALVEKGEIGGTCLNRGCIPTKSMVRDAELYRDVVSGESCIDLGRGIQADYGRLLERKRQVVSTLVGGVYRLLESRGVAVIRGTARILSPRVVQVMANAGPSQLQTEAIIVSTGSAPVTLKIPGADLPGVLTSDGLLERDALPRSLVVLGASVVGMEFACILHALGARVRVLERDLFLKDADPQLARRLRSILSQRGIAIETGAEALEIVQGHDGTLQTHYERGGQRLCAESEIVLQAVGRRPFTDGLGLDSAGIRTNGQAIIVDEHLETSVPGVYAVGDCIGGSMLAHVASYEGELAATNALGERRRADYRIVPSCIFTMPEIAGVGLTEAEAKRHKLDVKLSRFPFALNGRALAMGATEGQVRMLCEKGSSARGGRVLGVQIMGPHAGDLIAEAALAIRLGATAQDIAETIHAHPTLPEALMEAAMGQRDGAIHYDQSR